MRTPARPSNRAYNEALGWTLNQILFDRRLTRKQLGELLQISASVITRKLRGEVSWSAEEISLLAAQLNLSLDSFTPSYRADGSWVPAQYMPGQQKTPAPVGTGVSVAGEGLEPSTSRLLVHARHKPSRFRRFAQGHHTLRVRLEWIDLQLHWRIRGRQLFSPAAVEAYAARLLLSFASITGNRALGGNAGVTSSTGNDAVTGIGTIRGHRGVAGDSSNDAAGAVAPAESSHSLPSVNSPFLP